METVIMFILVASVITLLIWAIVRNRNKGESKLSVFEHPSTFKKAETEIVNHTPEKQKDSDTTFLFKTKKNNN